MDPRHKSAEVDPTKQGGRSLMIAAVPIGLLLALAVLVAVWFLAR